MTDEQLRGALMEAQDYMLSQLPKTEWHHEFSPKFLKKMKKLIAIEMHPIRNFLCRAAALLLAVMGISGVLVLGFSEEVRADIIRWFSEHLTDREYKYWSNMGEDVDVSQYTLEGNVPDGYQFLDRIEDEDQVDEIYINEDGAMLHFSVMSPATEAELHVVTDKILQRDIINLKGGLADLYLSENPGESNVIVWQGTNGVLFSIQGILEKEQLVEMAENLD